MKTMLKYLLIWFSIFTSKVYAQNLVPNPGFETTTTCALNGAGVLNGEVFPWNSPDQSSMDLYNLCSVSPLWAVPQNQFGYQYPHSGNGYIGGVMYNVGGYKEFSQVRLTSPLIANQVYCISFYVTVSNPQYTACNKIGMYISSSEILGTTAVTTMNLTPQVVELSVIMDTINWHLISGTYTAAGGEEYIIVGNFASIQSTDTLHFPETIGAGAAYYYIDDVDIHLQSSSVDVTVCSDKLPYIWNNNSYSSGGVYTTSFPGPGVCDSIAVLNLTVKSDPVINLGKDTTLCDDETLQINISIPGASYVWQDNTTNPVYTISEAGLYSVNTTQNGCSSSDTIAVSYRLCNCALSIPSAITPNGDGINDYWIISHRTCFQKIAVFIYNRYGGLIFTSNNYLNEWRGRYKNKELPDGTYYYAIRAVGNDNKEQVIKGNLTILR